MWSQFRGEEDRCRTVGSTDDTDSRCLITLKTECMSSEERNKDTQLGSRAEEEALRVGNQRTKIGHRTHSNEYEARIHACLYAYVQYIEQSALGEDVTVAMVVFARRIEELIVPHFCMEHVRSGQVSKQHTERYRQQEQRLILLLDGQPKQETGNGNHDQVFPAFALEYLNDAHAV